VPLKDLWFSYDHGPEATHSEEHGPEDEFLVSNVRPRYEATENDVKESRLKGHDLYRGHEFIKGAPVGSYFDKHVPHLFDDATDEDLAEALSGKYQDHPVKFEKLVQDVLSHKSAGEKVSKALSDSVVQWMGPQRSLCDQKQGHSREVRHRGRKT
jgi:hypothetical protein